MQTSCFRNSVLWLDIWKKYEKLLKEAVRKNHFFALQKLLEKEHLIDSIDEFKERCSKPLILAIKNKNICLSDRNVA